MGRLLLFKSASTLHSFKIRCECTIHVLGQIAALKRSFNALSNVKDTDVLR